ncbi:MAG: radical SAM protein [Planctomycetota bacterium]|jgi:MoaA/NifB/PqqE/SkfB family radical SAM enzyme/trans-aconitate methyltransferase
MKGNEFFTQVLSRPPFSKMHPKVASFFKDYLSNEKVIRFNGHYMVNTHFPPYPSKAFDNFVDDFGSIGDVSQRRLFSVTLAVTNRCRYNCWHCYNAGRSQKDMPLSALQSIAKELQNLRVVNLTLTGGEPLLREDLAQIAASFDDRTNLVLNTTGDGLTPERAQALRDAGIFSIGISLDSTDAEEHDRMRGKQGAFQTALKALETASQNGFYPYVIALATHDLIQPENFWPFMRFSKQAGALEVHLLEPSATGKLAGNKDVLLKKADEELIFKYQQEVAQDENMPILSCFLYLESQQAFGCGAGLTHLYIDGSGQVCPCNLVPLSFGNIVDEPFSKILDRMSRHFCKPRPGCVGKILCKHINSDLMPLAPEASDKICEKHLPRTHELPQFFKVRDEAQDEIGREDEFWLSEAGKPIENLIARIPLKTIKSVFEAGCGTGYGTLLLADKLDNSADITAVDLSNGMLAQAKKRILSKGFGNVHFIAGDALEILDTNGPFDLVFSSWVLGYIPLKAFFSAADRALKASGKLAFVVHKENSPREPLEIFSRLVALDPSILQKRIAFDFPQDMNFAEKQLNSCGFKVINMWDGNIVFRYDTAQQVLEHLLKSGAGTAYYDAVDPERRPQLEKQFIETITQKIKDKSKYEVIHDYICCIAEKA